MDLSILEVDLVGMWHHIPNSVVVDCTKFHSKFKYIFQKINEEDQRAFDLFMNPAPDTRKTVADVIMEKLTEKKTELHTQMSDDSRTLAGGEFQLDDRIVKMYTQIKHVLQKYRSGKLPKAFKILPSLNNWEHVSDLNMNRYINNIQAGFLS